MAPPVSPEKQNDPSAIAFFMNRTVAILRKIGYTSHAPHAPRIRVVRRELDVVEGFVLPLGGRAQLPLQERNPTSRP